MCMQGAGKWLLAHLTVSASMMLHGTQTGDVWVVPGGQLAGLQGSFLTLP